MARKRIIIFENPKPHYSEKEKIMQIKVRLFATLREGRSKEQMMDCEQPVSPLHVINELNIARKEVAILLVNGRDGTFDQELKEGDTVSIFPPVGGG